MLEPDRWLQLFGLMPKLILERKHFWHWYQPIHVFFCDYPLNVVIKQKWHQCTETENFTGDVGAFFALLSRKKEKKMVFICRYRLHLPISTNNINQLINSQALTNINLNMCRHIVTAGARLKPKCIVATVFPLIHTLSYYGMKYEEWL